jgi:phosphoglycolate phosphatase
MPPKKIIKAVLFDLDGTLLDTAPDLGFALNQLLIAHGRAALPHAIIRQTASHGARGLIKLGFDVSEGDAQFSGLIKNFLALYQQHLCDKTQLFSGMQWVLDYLTANHLPWGIVTNKPAYLTEPLLQRLNLLNKAACVISGDTLNKRKPDPEPLLHASDLLAIAPRHCVYIGDAERDIQAGNSADMHTLIARYGYIADTDLIADWNADGIIETAEEIVSWVI